jgi:tetratricopeptide (TPR) repeat protein
VTKAATTLLLIGVMALAPPPSWLHNPRERTASGLRAWEQGDQNAAARAFEQALELDASDPQIAFNAGTGHLAAGAPGAAMPLLERAAEAAGALRPDALYNLGNARLAADDAAGAIAAYEGALRLTPGHAAAKHNLELALRRQQEQEQQQPDESPSGGEGEGSPRPGDEGEGDPQAGPQPPAEGDEGEGQAGGDDQQPPAPGDAQRPAERSSRLPQFDPQEDMSADQAAALLEAVENLEREQRRADADQRRRQRGRIVVEKDW